ncbi:methylenetetrahydrofolate reductase [NAD(P)H] [Clostridium sediminicola]|uniref:methylenetetrahydrofolate reductase [NAD(P)H] n=1 Tax=Clostridium sediminicola TaxID=3114879 RepID=UPI0031F25D23
MHIKDLYSKKKPVISFEIFPPKRECNVDTIYNTVEEFANLNPDYISVTYGAGGVGSDKTVEIASMIKNKYKIEALAHLTCFGSSKERIALKIEELKTNNIENILAMRGDIQEEIILKSNTKYNYATDLIKDIRKFGGFSIGAAAYPEGHIECDDLRISSIHLKQKVDAGADFLITQLFFDNELFYKFLNLKEKLSVKVPISAGIMPILNKKQVQKMIFMCGASLPSKIIKILHKYESNPDSLRRAGIEYAAEQVIDLIANGVDGVHIYTMNQPEIAREILKNIQPKIR